MLFTDFDSYKKYFFLQTYRGTIRPYGSKGDNPNAPAIEYDRTITGLPLADGFVNLMDIDLDILVKERKYVPTGPNPFFTNEQMVDQIAEFLKTQPMISRNPPVVPGFYTDAKVRHCFNSEIFLNFLNSLTRNQSVHLDIRWYATNTPGEFFVIHKDIGNNPTLVSSSSGILNNSYLAYVIPPDFEQKNDERITAIKEVMNKVYFITSYKIFGPFSSFLKTSSMSSDYCEKYRMKTSKLPKAFDAKGQFTSDPTASTDRVDQSGIVTYLGPSYHLKLNIMDSWRAHIGITFPEFVRESVMLYAPHLEPELKHLPPDATPMFLNAPWCERVGIGGYDARDGDIPSPLSRPMPLLNYLFGGLTQRMINQGMGNLLPGVKVLTHGGTLEKATRRL